MLWEEVRVQVECEPIATPEPYPQVLLAAEFHQRYISSILKPAQRWNKTKLRAEIFSLYEGLYLSRSRLFQPLWPVSRLILRQAGIGA